MATFNNPATEQMWQEFRTAAIHRAIIEAMANVHAATIASITYEGVEDCPKKLGIIGKVTKLTSGKVQLYYTYENAVNNRLEAQGDERTFKAQGLKWGEWLIFNKFITHKGGLYLRCYTFNGGNLTPNYFVNGREATNQENIIIREWKKDKKGSNTQTAEGLTEHQVEPFSVNVLNIITLSSGTCQFRRYDVEQQALRDFCAQYVDAVSQAVAEIA